MSRCPRLLALAPALALATATAILAAATPGRADASAPDFTVRTVTGKPFRLSAQRGRVVVVDFLVATCRECQLEAPVLERAAARFQARGLRVLILDMDCCALDRELSRFYHRRLGLEHVLVAADRGLRVARRYGVSQLGTTVIVGRDGSRIWQGTWLGREQQLFRRIAQALG